MRKVHLIYDLNFLKKPDEAIKNQLEAGLRDKNIEFNIVNWSMTSVFPKDALSQSTPQEIIIFSNSSGDPDVLGHGMRNMGNAGFTNLIIHYFYYQNIQTINYEMFTDSGKKGLTCFQNVISAYQLQKEEILNTQQGDNWLEKVLEKLDDNVVIEQKKETSINEHKRSVHTYDQVKFPCFGLGVSVTVFSLCLMRGNKELKELFKCNLKLKDFSRKTVMSITMFCVGVCLIAISFVALKKVCDVNAKIEEIGKAGV